MSTDKPFTKENLNECLKELAKEFRRNSGTKIPAELILIGGASILANYGFREMTYDIDAIILASTAMKDAIDVVGDRLGLPIGWLNADFKRTPSFSNKLLEVSVYYKTFSNVLAIRTVAAEYLVAMKLMSGRKYKNDLSDIVGILWEHQKVGAPITPDAVERAVADLYGGWGDIPQHSKQFIDAAFERGDYEAMYLQSRVSEAQAKNILTDFDKAYPGQLKGENIDTILEIAKKRRQRNDRDR